MRHLLRLKLGNDTRHGPAGPALPGRSVSPHGRSATKQAGTHSGRVEKGRSLPFHQKGNIHLHPRNPGGLCSDSPVMSFRAHGTLPPEMHTVLQSVWTRALAQTNINQARRWHPDSLWGICVKLSTDTHQPAQPRQQPPWNSLAHVRAPGTPSRDQQS